MRRSVTLLLLLTLAASGVRAQQKTPPSGMKPMRGMDTTGGMGKMAGMNKMHGMDTAAGMGKMAGMQHAGMATMATQSGQAAFAAIAEVVKILEADSTTDWSKVNLEALRQHLIDMDNVTMRSQVRQTPIAAGLVMNVTGTPSVAAAIQRMVGMHTMMLGEGSEMVAKVVKIPGGMRFTVTARDSADIRLVARIRGLGFIGLMTEGEHHQMHHLMVARSGMMPMKEH